jgi:hypothetical protein
MASANNDLFYSRLPVNQIALSDLLTENHLFYPIPSNWHVIVTDVKNSTEAVANNLHETINLVATGSIVAVLNIAYKQNISVPYFFGGDGATFIIPSSILNEVLIALTIHQQNTYNNYNITFRVGQVPVDDIYSKGYLLNISKLSLSNHYSIPVILGEGLSFAEKLIKGEDYLLNIPFFEKKNLDLSGMQCRWDKIKPPENNNEVVSLLVIAREETKQAEVFSIVIGKLDHIYGHTEKRNPISVSKLKLKVTLKKIGEEMKVKLGAYRPIQIFKSWFTTMLGSLYFRTKHGKKYLIQLVDFSDTLVIDGKINTVISGTTQQRELLENDLNQMEFNKQIYYGIFVSKESIMSCYVRSMEDNHVHFVDGANGGYTKAAGILKTKLVTD